MTLPVKFKNTDLDRWGVGKLSRLTSLEADENIWALYSLIAEITSELPQPVNIASINVTDNQMTILLEDSTEFGPFTLPVASFAWRSEWEAGTEYDTWNFFKVSTGLDAGLYLVVQPHTSASEFNPADGNMSGPYVELIVAAAPADYAVSLFVAGLPGDGLSATDSIYTFIADRSFFLQTDLPGTQASLEKSAASQVIYPIYKNDVAIGQISFGGADSESEGSDEPELDPVFTFAADVQFTPGDRLRILAPEEGADSNATGLSVTFAGNLGTL